MVAIDVPSEYGWVIAACGIAPTITMIMLGGEVMKARKKYDVQYPTMYAVPGVHKEHVKFNNVQRGHQNALENLPGYICLSFIGGLKNPIACAVGGLIFCAGRFLYMEGYKSDANQRYSKGGPILWIGFLTSMISSGMLAYDLINSK